MGSGLTPLTLALLALVVLLGGAVAYLAVAGRRAAAGRSSATATDRCRPPVQPMAMVK